MRDISFRKNQVTTLGSKWEGYPEETGRDPAHLLPGLKDYTLIPISLKKNKKSDISSYKHLLYTLKSSLFGYRNIEF